MENNSSSSAAKNPPVAGPPLDNPLSSPPVTSPSHPGSFEQLHRETRGVFANNFAFDGAKFEFGKILSPIFQVQHTFTLGSSQLPPSYSFGAVYAKKAFLQGSVDHEGNVQARANYPLTSALTAKFQSQLARGEAPSMMQLEADYVGAAFNVNAKAINPMPNGTGIFVFSYLHSIISRLSLGIEMALQRPTPSIQEGQLSLVARHTGDKHVFTTNLSQLGILQSSYHHKISDTVELAAEVQVITAQSKREAVCTFGGKWEFRQACYRGMVDTSGRVCAVLEERMAPGFSVFFSGDLDHMKGQHKFGIGMTIEN